MDSNNVIFILEAKLITNCEKCSAPMKGNYDPSKSFLVSFKCVGCSNEKELEFEVNNEKTI